MLTPPESGFFDAIAGLPMHPLVVHFAVVLLPLAALGLIVLVAVPRWVDTFGWLTLGALVVGVAASFVAKESGEALAARVGTPGDHASWGDVLPWLAVGLLVLAGAWFVLHRRARQAESGRSAAATAVGILAAVLALAVTGVTIVVGHTGAQAAWGGTITSATAPATPGTDGGAEGSASAGGTTYTLADVAKHASASSCWTAVDGTVYDVTKWITQHPGGKQPILGMCGTDGSAAFHSQHGSQSRPANELKQFRIGTLSAGTGGSASPSAPARTSYTLADVAKHGSASSCWTAVNGKVYDVTEWITQHPGGRRAILGMCGKDGSSAFDGQHGGQRRPEAELKQFLVGTLG
jgi:cytochrome b involved in lipid metabolism/uncharacterized membrane protein